jgi:hypothetical protein
MIHLTRPDVAWLKRLLDITEYIYREYPELFSKEDVEALTIASQLIEDLDL